MAAESAANQAASSLKSTDLIDKIVLYFIDHGLQVLIAIAIMAAGILVTRWVGNYLQRWLTTKALDPPVRTLAVRITKLLLIALVGIIALGQMGVQITPLIAGIGVLGVGLSLAMQGLLANIVAGLTIIFTKPFTVGEYIELLGVYGQVTDISLSSTTLLHLDNSHVVVPNRKIVGEVMHNYGKIRQLNLSVGIAYDADLDLALSMVNDILQLNSRVLKDPPPVVGIAALGDSAISLAIKPWVTVEDFIFAQAEIYQTVLERFRERRIEIPFPQREIRLLNELGLIRESAALAHQKNQ